MKENNKWVWLDMDGTICDLYGVDGWLDDLIAMRTRPYDEAKSIYNEVDLMEVLLNLKADGFSIGVISWGSKVYDEDFHNRIVKAKMDWIISKAFDLVFDKVIVTPYGVKKSDTCKPYGYGILVDDEEQNLNAWENGATISAKRNIIEELRKLVA